MVCQQNVAFSKCLDNAVKNLQIVDAVFLCPSFVPLVWMQTQKLKPSDRCPLSVSKYGRKRIILEDNIYTLNAEHNDLKTWQKV